MKFKTEFLENSEIQLIDGDRGKNYPKQADFSQQGDCLFLSAKNVTLSGFEFSETSFINKEKDEILRSGKLQRGDIVVTTRGTIGNIAFYSDDVPFDHIRINSGMMIFRASEERWNRRFLYFLLTSNFIKQQIESLTSGSAVPQLPARDLKKFELPNIPKGIQDSIEKIIGDLSDKIKLNRQTNQTLEHIAQVIFKSWFVDFEPVKAKIAAKQAFNALTPAEKAGLTAQDYIEQAAQCAIAGKTKEQLQQLDSDTQQKLKTTAALFPDALVDSELGDIPDGWGAGMMQDCCERVESGGTPSRKEGAYWNGSIKWLSSGEVRNVIILNTKEKITEKGLKNSNAKLWPKGSTVVAMYGATAGQVCLLASEVTANQACCALVPKNNQESYMFLSAKRSIESLAGKASGSAQQNLNKSLVSEHELLIPPPQVLTEFENIASKLINKWQQNIKENHELTELRDTLLPKLLSGELTLSSDKVAEMAGTA